MGKYWTNLQKSSVSLVSGDAQSYRLSKARKKRHFVLVIYVLLFSIIHLTNSYSPTTAQHLNTSNIQDILNKSAQGDVTNNSTFLHIPSVIGYNQPNCSRPSIDEFPPDLFTEEQRQNGAIAIHFLASFYIFYALLLVCDEYFVPSVECICRAFKIPSDIAGCSIMAIGTSAPELFTNVIGTFVTKGDIGVGTIVGSAVFNILAVGAGCGFCAGLAKHKIKGADGRIGVPLEWYPLSRDCIFYLLSVALLVFALSNGRIYWTEALSMILLYFLYIVAMCNNSRLKGLAEKLLSKTRCLLSIKEDQSGPRKVSFVVEKLVASEKTPLLLTQNEKGELSRAKIDSNSDSSGSNDLREYELSAEALDEVLITSAVIRSSSFSKNKEVPRKVCNYPLEEDWTSRAEWIFSWPIRLVFALTIPDCRRFGFRKWYLLTLIMCVVWIAFLSYIVTFLLTIIGDTLDIPDSVTGLTFLAAGTSIPEVLSSIIVARQGLGSMALSNSIGSNTFDILFCLGLPWLIQTLILSNSEKNYIEIHSGGLEYSALLLIASLVVLYIVVAANGFLLDRKVGLISLFMYIVFVTLACLLEMNVFFPVNLPICDT